MTMTGIVDLEGREVEHPYDRGYWARIAGVDVAAEDLDYQEGWDEADAELKSEAAEWEAERVGIMSKRLLPSG